MNKITKIIKFNSKCIRNKSNKVNNYRYIVSINSKSQPPLCKYPKEQVKTGIRYNRFIYENGDFKKIIYPCDLLFMYINEDDIIESNIIKLKNDWPNWYAIKVELIEE